MHEIGNSLHRMSVKVVDWMSLQVSKYTQRPNVWHAYYYYTKKQQEPYDINIIVIRDHWRLRKIKEGHFDNVSMEG